VHYVSHAWFNKCGVESVERAGERDKAGTHDSYMVSGAKNDWTLA